MASHSRTLAWRIPGTAEPGGLPSMESQNRTRLKRLSSSSSSIFSERFPSFSLYLFWWMTRISYCVHVVFPWLMRLKFSYMFIKNRGNSGGGGRISAGIASAAGAGPPTLHCRWGSQRWHWPSALMRTVILSSWRDRYQSAGECQVGAARFRASLLERVRANPNMSLASLEERTEHLSSI